MAVRTMMIDAFSTWYNSGLVYENFVTFRSKRHRCVQRYNGRSRTFDQYSRFPLVGVGQIRIRIIFFYREQGQQQGEEHIMAMFSDKPPYLFSSSLYRARTAMSRCELPSLRPTFRRFECADDH